MVGKGWKMVWGIRGGFGVRMRRGMVWGRGGGMGRRRGEVIGDME